MHSLRNTFSVLLFIIALASGSTVQLYGLDYTARRINYCPSQAQVNQDMQIISSLAKYVRMYSMVDCNQGVMVLEAIKQLNLPLRVTLGVWVDIYFYAEFPNEYAALQNINNVYGLSKVDSIIVGSETQYRGDFSVDLLISYIGNISTTVKQEMGYPQIQITTADVIDSLAGLPQLIAAVDFVAYNEFAFWENIAIADAVQHTITRYNNFLPSTQGKKVVISEVGWPTQGDAQGNSVPTAANSNQFFQGIVCWATTNNIPLYYFAAFDSLWQQDDDQKHWGLYGEDRTLKAGISFDFPCASNSGASTGTQGTQATPSPTKATTGATVQSSSSRASVSTNGQASSTSSASASQASVSATTSNSAASSTSKASASTASKASTSTTSQAASTGKATSTAKAASTIGGSSSSQSAASSTTGFNTCPACGTGACCMQNGSPACYNPDSYTCVKVGNSNQLCGFNTHNQKKYFDGVCNGGCYDTFCYSCPNNALVPTGAC